ncbi:F-box protein, partial [Trifolium medium]|nr:F-box protein [Trifolium medium]
MNSVDNQTDVSSSSHSPAMEEEISVVKDHLSILTLSVSSDAQPLTTLSFDLIEEILCRLPVKLLVQLRCV